MARPSRKRTRKSPGDGVSVIDRDAPIFVISVAAQLAGLHPQTLRTYDRIGLVSPRRTAGRGRRYSPRDVARLRLIQRLSQDEGVNLEGIRRILELESELELLREQVGQLTDLLRQAHAAPAGSRVFAADPTGGVRLTPAQQARRAASPPKAIGR
ncbi:heat shock protein transcriptional repressor HspR [Granulicoccus sp. GXG6511]|uniref:heat shock protein transcriptional repressor HspR n=1 Tax=Granulicoccus sp. GXG6511 TaxID=3381351 RepID=UPI003D7D722B